MVSATRIAAGFLLSLSLASPAAATATRESIGIESGETRLAMDFLSALGRLDFDAAAGFLDENAELDLPYAGRGVTLRGRAQVIGFFRRTMSGKVGHIAYRLDHAYPSREKGAIVLEVSTTVETASGGSAANRLVTIFRFERGKIVLFREYFNPVPVAAPSPP